MEPGQRPLRITFINRLMGIFRGGGENADLHLARALRSLGCEVRFLIGRRWRKTDLPLDEFPTTYIRTPYLRGVQYRLANHPFWPLRKLAAVTTLLDLTLFAWEVLRRLRSEGGDRADVYQLCGLPYLGARIRRFQGRPTVIRWPGPPPEKWRGWALACAANFAGGDALVEARRLLGPQVKEITIGVDTERFRPRERLGFWQQKGGPEGALVVLFVGRLIPIKNLPLLLGGFARAAKDRDDLFLALVGEGGEVSSLQRATAQLGVEKRVVFTGALTGEELATAYGEADIFAITSTYDNFPNVVLEAMASGLPLVATRVGGIPLQVQDGVNGCLIPSGDEAGLGRALLRLAHDPEMRRRLGETNRRKAEQEYSWLESGRRLLALYREILEERR